MPRFYPKLPVTASKAYMRLLTAIVNGDSGLARWVRWAIDNDQVIGSPTELSQLTKKLDEVMEPENG